MRAAALLVAIAVATPAAAFFREGDFKPAKPATIAVGHAYQCLIEVSFTEANPVAPTVSYTDHPSCTAADAMAMRYALAAAYCSMGGDPGDIARCVAGIAPARAEDPGFFSKAGGSCQVGIFFDAVQPRHLEIHWSGICVRAAFMLGMRYATTMVLCARNTHCVAGPAWPTLSDPGDPKVYAPRPSSGPKTGIGIR